MLGKFTGSVYVRKNEVNVKMKCEIDLSGICIKGRVATGKIPA